MALPLWVAENRPFPLLWLLAYTTACTIPYKPWKWKNIVFVGTVGLYSGEYGVHVRESVKEVHIIDNLSMINTWYIFSKVDKMNNDVVQQCFSNFKRGDKYKRLRNDYGFIVHDSLLAYRVHDKFCLQFP